MAVNMKGKSITSMLDLSTEEIWQILELAKTLKHERLSGIKREILKGRTLAMIFQKPSTRTRVSFEVGMYELGGYALYLSASDLQLRRGETIADTARVLSRYVDVIMARVYAHKDIVDLATYATVPVINGLSDFEHPMQTLADFLTVWEKKGTLRGIKFAYVGDGNNVANSLIFGAALIGMDIYVASPKGYEPLPEVVGKAKEIASRMGSKVVITNDPIEAVKDADVIYTDVWASMGQEAEAEERRKIFQPYQVNPELVKHAKPDFIFMHCLPAHRGEEVVDEVIDSPNSVVFDQAENRLHAQKAVLALIVR